MVFKNLFEPITIKHLTIKNRVFVAPMHVNLGSMEEGITENAINFYEARAKGGFGLMAVNVIDTMLIPSVSSSKAFFLENKRHVKNYKRLV